MVLGRSHAPDMLTHATAHPPEVGDSRPATTAPRRHLTMRPRPPSCASRVATPSRPLLAIDPRCPSPSVRSRCALRAHATPSYTATPTARCSHLTPLCNLHAPDPRGQEPCTLAAMCILDLCSLAAPPRSASSHRHKYPC